MPPAITMGLYFLIFGKLIGTRVGQMDGFDYMHFIVPGLVMMSVIQNSYGNISSSFFGAKFGRHVEELLVSPMPNWVILWGYVAGAVLSRGDGRRHRDGHRDVLYSGATTLPTSDIKHSCTGGNHLLTGRLH